MYIDAPMNVAPSLSELVEEPGQPISGVPLSPIGGRRNPAMQEPRRASAQRSVALKAEALSGNCGDIVGIGNGARTGRHL